MDGIIILFQLNDKDLITVSRHGGFVTTPLTEVVNNHIFNGRENDIMVLGDYTTRFICSFNMQYYPFDIQECRMTFMLTVCTVMKIADRKSQVRQCLGVCTADFVCLLAYDSAEQKPKHCLT